MITTTLKAFAAAALLSVTLAGCGGSDSGGDTNTNTNTNTNSDDGGSDAKTGEMFCSAIKKVQADLLPDAVSAAYLAQLTLKLDPTVVSKLSATEVDKATKKECPTEYEKFLDQAEITSLVDLGLQP